MSPFALGLFTNPTDVPATATPADERYDPELQLTIRRDGTPRVADSFTPSQTSGGLTTSGEKEIFDVFPEMAELC
ncbi:putative ATP-grasp-modified RiPP [Streptomyces sp. 8L]|uniref:putative ATP-grasp-modified RiPP n=1 Tax=Streptomyces sp. 8L TaxID=2877242 RepID=UPI001CD31840|nr:putative ATP-grasp-modified RiPP [Streptomyces sp. 8L]MCA1220055.1 putative ATP-grasp-modified RiPP [Streptomyces sp. 8L]